MKKLILLMFFTLSCFMWANSLPEVSNLSFSQRTDGSMLIDVYYDVFDADGDTLTVTMEVSDDDGETWTVSCDSISGDAGEGILSGSGKQIVWNFGVEHPGVFSEEYRLRILVNDNSNDQGTQWCIVPAGEYTWGENDEIQTIDYDYEIMKYEVTNAQYLIYLEEAYAADDVWIQNEDVYGYYEGDEYNSAGNYIFYDFGMSSSYNFARISFSDGSFIINVPSGYNAGDFDDHPVVNVTWFGANAYAIHNDLRLPTEEEWEKAARGMTGYEYPWGDNLSNDRANYRNSGDPWDNGTTPVGYYNGQNGTTDSPSPYGCYDMCGNVFSWTNSWYSEYYRVSRGGSWISNSTDEGLHTWSRRSSGPAYAGSICGFRLCRTVEPENSAPAMPSNPSPGNGAIGVSLESYMTWECSDPNGDELSYDVYFGTNPLPDSEELVSLNQSETSYSPEPLQYETTYYWKIVASDSEYETESPVWSFTTIEEIPVVQMVYVEGGTFEMGDHFNEGDDDELPVHEVMLSSFYIGQYEVTQNEYESVMGINPATGQGVGGNNPVYNIEWLDAITYCNALSVQEGLTPCYNYSGWICDFNANGYRLPTEAEWEYAARGGVNWIDNYRFSGTTDNLEDYAWYNANANGHLHEVGTKLPNQLGIYDMSGNAREWCNDWWSDSYYNSSPVNNPTGPASGTLRVIRGGEWFYYDSGCRVAFREYALPDDTTMHKGFRILRKAD